MHSLEHIVAVVRLWGPLWSYSMFAFENLNGYLGKTYHGTHKIVYQMSFQIQLHQSLPDKLLQLRKNESVEVQAYIDKILPSNSNRMHQIDTNCYAIGTLSMHTLTDEERSVATTCGFIIPNSNVTCFSRPFEISEADSPLNSGHSSQTGTTSDSAIRFIHHLVWSRLTHSILSAPA
uniref:Uncharacterized protein n=1 Tax=Amphimedon queenslandica TaxID=400682 RepID=A0A1X7V260_AMPQE